MNSDQPRVAVYLRISQDREDTRLGVDRHGKAAEELAHRRGWKVAEVYEDNDISAKGRRKRPDFERLLADVEAGKIDAIIAQEWPRLERNRSDGVRIIEACQKHLVLLTFVKGQDIDCSTASGRMIADFMSALARNEIEVKAERQSGAQLQRATQGRPPKGVRPLGYAVNGDVIMPEAAVVAELYRLFAIEDGPSLRSLAAGLSGETGPRIPKTLPALPRQSHALALERNEKRAGEGLPPNPVPPDGPWDTSTMLGILRNPRYAGYSVYTDRNDRAKNKRRSWYAQVLRDENGDPVKGQWEPIVDEAVWHAVQERLDDPDRVTNRTGSTSRRHLGSSLYLCGICEQPMPSHSRGYRCEGHVMRSREKVDEWVVENIRARLARPDLADTLPSIDEPRLKAIQAQIAVHQGKIMRAQRDYDAELIEAFDLKRVRDHEGRAMAALEAERRSLTAPTDLGGVLDAKDPVQAFDDADLMIKRRVIDFFCEVRLYPSPRGRKTFDPATVAITPKGQR